MTAGSIIISSQDASQTHFSIHDDRPGRLEFFRPGEQKLLTVHQAISTPDFGYLLIVVGRSKGMFAQQAIDLKLLVVSNRAASQLLAREVRCAATRPPP